MRTFADLHSYVDANDYLQGASVPFDGSNTTVELIATATNAAGRYRP